jgi:ATP-dependent DNA helicase RecG
MRRRDVGDDYCIEMIIKTLEKFGSTSRNDFEELLLEMLPNTLTDSQKKDKIKNLLQKLRREGRIELGNN